eukprot:TRINITY_DN67632_c8_g1_i1.p3 TRINITY_DN67632_c8_g1~~TRINITY_DN67632_c8_g1_i1.p3  ORF type:complete len:104 (-),score=9.33 TRINITY_DN67632_c8_g1_i1:499-810(-)
MAEEWPPQWPWKPYHMGPPVSPSDAWTVYKGHLYLNINPMYNRHWRQNADRYIEKARVRWQNYYGSITAGPFNTDCWPNTWQHCNPNNTNFEYLYSYNSNSKK